MASWPCENLVLTTGQCRQKSRLSLQFDGQVFIDVPAIARTGHRQKTNRTQAVVFPTVLVQDRVQTDAGNRNAISHRSRDFRADVVQPVRARAAFGTCFRKKYRFVISLVNFREHRFQWSVRMVS
jgi:hypothetical protein